MVTFEVSTVEEPSARKRSLDRGSSIRLLMQKPVVGMYKSDARLVVCDDSNHFARAVHDAFYEHRPLTLTPDAVWFCIASGFAHHMSLHAEELRSRFVGHRERLVLRVERPDFELGKDNPWPEAFAAFSDEIAAHVGKARDLVVCDFSTTGPVQRAASEVLLMDTFQTYFHYEMKIGCGIPRIHLLGTVEDWRSVRARARMLAEYGLERWIDVLDPVLEQFEQAARGRASKEFWRSMFRYASGSGQTDLSGWIHVLFPYLRERDRLVWNRYMAQWSRDVDSHEQRTRSGQYHGPSFHSLPPALASAPVRVQDLRTEQIHELRFVAGLFGVVEDAEDGALAPEFGWAVVYDGDGAPSQRSTLVPFQLGCRTSGVGLYERTDGRFQMMEAGTVAPIVWESNHTVLVERSLGELLAARAEGVELHPAVIWRRRTDEEFRTHVRLVVHQSGDWGRPSDLTFDAQDGRLLVGPALKAALEDAGFDDLTFTPTSYQRPVGTR
jgi:hypothetical protein